jgi:hypothetical protein
MLQNVDFTHPDPSSCALSSASPVSGSGKFLFSVGCIMQNPNTTGIQPVIMSVKDACQWSHLSRSEVYCQLAAGTIGAVKLRSRTFVLMDSLRQFIANLPSAKFSS